MILKNGIITPDGTELISEHVHDFKMHIDKITGKEYAVDGGNEYQRLLGDMNDCKIIFIKVNDNFSDEEFELIRENFKWDTRGKDGMSPYKQKKLKELSNSHLQAILDTQKHLSKQTIGIFTFEMKYRIKNSIIIKD
jgi:hypothetical protein